jgi:hypothetical protein
VTVIVIHVGMPKAGSTSIQQWLETNSATLREQGFTVAALSQADAAEGIAFAPYERGGVNFSSVITRFGREAHPQWEKFANAFVAELTSCAERYGNVVVSGEAFAMNARPPILTRLQQLTAQHEVRIACYVRPQHTSLEAMWREWGYRSGKQPSAYIEQATPAHRYATGRRALRAVAPGLEFEPRPFREDLLDGGDVVVDFAQRFLGVEVNGAGERANRGLPLEMVNLLRAAPHGMFWDSLDDYDRLHRVKQLHIDQHLPEDDRIALSRQVLRKYAFDRFAAENAELGWDDFVPPPDDNETPRLGALDQLWAPRASPAELDLLFRALDAAIQD